MEGAVRRRCKSKPSMGGQGALSYPSPIKPSDSNLFQKGTAREPSGSSRFLGVPLVACGGTRPGHRNRWVMVCPGGVVGICGAEGAGCGGLAGLQARFAPAMVEVERAGRWEKVPPRNYFHQAAVRGVRPTGCGRGWIGRWERRRRRRQIPGRYFPFSLEQRVCRKQPFRIRPWWRWFARTGRPCRPRQ